VRELAVDTVGCKSGAKALEVPDDESVSFSHAPQWEAVFTTSTLASGVRDNAATALSPTASFEVMLAPDAVLALPPLLVHVLIPLDSISEFIRGVLNGEMSSIDGMASTSEFSEAPNEFRTSRRET
jgi:hypothetical protein